MISLAASWGESNPPSRDIHVSNGEAGAVVGYLDICWIKRFALALATQQCQQIGHRCFGHNQGLKYR
ncbi:unnamed protein product, partial [Vitis vinifera]